MSRVRRARSIAAAAMYGGGGITALGLVGVGVLTAQAHLARRAIGKPHGPDGPLTSGRYGAGPGTPIRVLFLGDSLAVGLGADRPEQTAAAIVASGVAAIAGRAVELTNVATIGAHSSDLAAQLRSAATTATDPVFDLAVIIVGGNDVTHSVDQSVAVRDLAAMVQTLRSKGVQVLVATCPDLGTLRPVPHPLRWLARRASRQLAAAQTIAVVEHGGRTVSLGDILGPEFAAAPADLFSADQFHPSPAGYARLGSALLPSVCAALQLWSPTATEPQPDSKAAGGRYAPVATAAVSAAERPGTEVVGASVQGRDRGIAGRWATLRTRRLRALVPESDRTPQPATKPGGAAELQRNGLEAAPAAGPATSPIGPPPQAATRIEAAVVAAPGAPSAVSPTGQISVRRPLLRGFGAPKQRGTASARQNSAPVLPDPDTPQPSP